MDDKDAYEIRVKAGAPGEVAQPCKAFISPDGENTVRVTLPNQCLVLIIDGPAAIRAISDCINWVRKDGRLV